ncbi:MAG: hypothetical protein ACUVQ8_07040 [Nitrososphaeria archaeon]
MADRLDPTKYFEYIGEAVEPGSSMIFRVVESTFMYHYVRLIEVLFCIEYAKQILQDPRILGERVWLRLSRVGGRCKSCRGSLETLIHHYKVEKYGKVT